MLFSWPIRTKKKILTCSLFPSDETPFLSPADKLFKLYDGVETFVMFIGYARSRHSLVAAILDAHPEIIIPHEYDVIKHWEEYQSSILKQKNMQKYQLFFDLHQHSLKQAMLGVRADANYMVLNENTYTYHIPGLWQGGYERRIKVNDFFSAAFSNRGLSLMTLPIKAKH